MNTDKLLDALIIACRHIDMDRLMVSHKKDAETIAAALRAEQAVGDEQRARELLAEEYDAAGFHGAAVDARSSEPSPHCAVTIRAIRRALGTARQSEGVVLVPREPTLDMKRAGSYAVSCLTHDGAMVCYRAMLAAAPGGEGEG